MKNEHNLSVLEGKKTTVLVLLVLEAEKTKALKPVRPAYFLSI